MELARLLQLLSLVAMVSAGKLRVDGTDFKIGISKVFLSGPNIAWSTPARYGNDFGNNQYIYSGSTLRSYVNTVAANGGNTIRIFLHTEGYYTPNFDWDGYTINTDASNTLISDLNQFLSYCQMKDVQVIIVLWNGALMRNQKVVNLVWDTSKLQRYIDNALKPMVQALKTHAALAAWEIINEPEGSLYPGMWSSNPCFDTRIFSREEINWTGKWIPMHLFLRFINWQADAIHSVSSSALVTVGAWSEKSQTDSFSNTCNYYQDSCLLQAPGARPLGTLDFYQIHTYAHNSHWNTNGPFRVNAASYGLDKPLLIGEFSHDCSEGEPITSLFEYLYCHGYDGGLTWQYNEAGECADTRYNQNVGFSQLHNQNDPSKGGLVNIRLRPIVVRPIYTSDVVSRRRS